MKKFAKGLGILSIIMICFYGTVPAAEPDPQMTGLPELTEAELRWQNTHMRKVRKVKLNAIALERINQWRGKRGKSAIDASGLPVAKTGKELETVVGADSLIDTSSPVPGEDIPGSIDNSQLQYFPPIRSQGSLNSCGSFSGVYYAMTYMHALAKDLDAKDGGDQYRLSPKWAYNMVNEGTNIGSWYYWAYEIGQKHGVSTWEEFPYDSDYREWNLEPDTWENSLYRRFDQYGYVGDTHTDAGIDQVRQMLLNGYILNIPTYINSWVWQTIADDPSTTDDDEFVGKQCAAWVNGTQGYHAMTVVGYDDSIWVDINGNNTVDSGEKGAFRIANSWGTGWGDGGFAWMAYDALKQTSGVSDGPSQDRVYGWSPARAHWVTAKSDYSPKLIAQFSLTHLKRDHLRITLGLSETGQTDPSEIWYPEMIYNQGGAYGFDGSTSSSAGTFVFDFTDLLPSGGGLRTYYLGIQDDTAGDEAGLSSFELIDLTAGRAASSSTDAPLTIDGDSVYATVAYDYSDGNLAPEAVADASVVSGEAPLAVDFDGSASSDPDGSIVSWEWDFGDQSAQSGESVSHTYDQAGTYTAVLTVTDDMGAQATAELAIDVAADPSLVVWVSDLSGTLVSKTSGDLAEVTVTILDLDSMPVSGAAVQGTWSGLVSGDAYGTTASDGTVVFESRKSKKSGAFTFTVDNVTASGYTYDASFNSFSSLEISNQSDTGDDVAVHVSGITMTMNQKGSNSEGVAVVSVADESGSPVQGAVISATWSGIVSGSASGTSDSSGSVTLTSPKTRESGTITLTVDGISGTGFTYAPENNVETSDIIDIP